MIIVIAIAIAIVADNAGGLSIIVLYVVLYDIYLESRLKIRDSISRLAL